MTRIGMMDWLAGALLASTGIAAADTPPYLFNDINKTQVITASSCPGTFNALGDHVYFAANDWIAGTRIWRTDGTEDGTVPWSAEGLTSVSGQELSSNAVLGHQFFFAFTDDWAIELWVTDGTVGGTKHVGGLDSAIDTDYFSSGLNVLFGYNGNVYALLDNALWRLSADFGSAERVLESQPGVTLVCRAASDRIYMPRWDEAHGIELWATDGSVGGEYLVKDLITGPDSGLDPPWGFGMKSVGALAVFNDSENSIWRTDGTEEGTLKLVDKVPSGGAPLWLGGNGVRAYYAVGSGEAWVTDGTPTGTVRVWQSPDTGYLGYGQRTVDSSGGLYFTVEHDALGDVLWYCDGTEDGSTALNAPQDGWDTLLFGPEIAGRVHFAGRDGDMLFLASTNGTQAGTTRSVDIPIAEGNDVCDRTQISPTSNLPGGQFAFAAYTTEGRELWISDGTPEGTKLLRNIYAESTSSSPYYISKAASHLVMEATTNEDRGMLAGNAVKDEALSRLGQGTLWNAVVMEDRILFEGPDDAPYRTDGTVAGTGPLVPGWEHDDYTGGTRRFDEWFGRSDQFAYFSADVLYGSNSFKDELWKSDGTTSGTALVKRFDDGSGELLGFTPRGVRFRSMVFFSARAAGDLLLGLWKSDGTLEGTIPVPAPQVVDPRNFSPLQKHTFFTAELPGIRYIFGLWKSDGTGEGTVYLNPIIPTTSVVELAGQGYFKAVDAGAKAEQLWRSNGTPEGTLPIKTFTPGPGGVRPLRNDLDPIVVAGRLAFFAANDGVVGRELWVLDTRAGEEIRLVADIRPGADGSNLHNMVARGERIFFTANDGVHGVELWQSDGSPEGTTMMGDIYPGDLPSGPESLTVFGNRLIFSATDGSATGRELWAVDLDILPQTGWILNGGYQ